ncbi:DUF3077 domain-containing protein [Pseudomonas sp. MD195_PC81_125]|uniref:DUF3077 domain-containing protein n=1 Tax=Pseudomonas sp. MD195_PC81_125 TaxID=2741560 RepID=UPI0015F9AC03|nr:DUF3077 domain-containing protein [Pseudomonas sp. MD195_PC81_125]MBA5978732.1 DUF3077 domain-containing protein [Pseudomonas sp. MD195_PC81_125]
MKNGRQKKAPSAPTLEAYEAVNISEDIHMKQDTASQEKLNAGAIKVPLTVESSFVSCNVERQELLAVRPGIPAVDALNQASCILYSVRESLCEAGMQTLVISPSQAWLLHMAVESAKAVIDSVGEGLEKLA